MKSCRGGFCFDCSKEKCALNFIFYFSSCYINIRILCDRFTLVLPWSISVRPGLSKGITKCTVRKEKVLKGIVPFFNTVFLSLTLKLTRRCCIFLFFFFCAVSHCYHEFWETAEWAVQGQSKDSHLDKNCTIIRSTSHRSQSRSVKTPGHQQCRLFLKSSRSREWRAVVGLWWGVVFGKFGGFTWL